MKTEAPKPRLIRRAEVIARVSLARSTIYKRIAAGEFPRPIPIGGGRVAWIQSDIDNWINERLAEAGRDAAA
jgi:prophage regulatory protein